MKKQTLFVVEKHIFNQCIVETNYNVPGDLNIFKKQPEDFKPNSSTLIGIFSNKDSRNAYLKDKHIHFAGDCGDSDYYGSYTSYTYISGYYHTASEKQLSTIVIKDKQYAEYNNMFIEIDQISSKKEQEQEDALIK